MNAISYGLNPDPLFQKTLKTVYNVTKLLLEFLDINWYANNASEITKHFIYSLLSFFTLFCTFQETLKEFFPSWEHIKLQEEVIVFTCGLMKDPIPLVNHVYQTYLERICNLFYLSGIQRDDETEMRLIAQGKKIDAENLFNTLYTESRIPLFGQPHYNQFVCMNANQGGEIDTPSRIYGFLEMSKDDVPLSKFTKQDGSEDAPECMLCIHKPDAAALKSLLSTCCEISKRQPVTHLSIRDVTCEDLTPAEAPALSRNIQAICVLNCDLPTSF